MYRRKHARTVMVLGIRLIGRDSDSQELDELTHTLDIGIGGARIAGIYKRILRVGDIVELRRRHRRGRFRVAWVGVRGSGRDGQVGLQAVDAPANFWELPMPAHGDFTLSLTGRASGTEENRRGMLSKQQKSNPLQ